MNRIPGWGLAVIILLSLVSLAAHADCGFSILQHAEKSLAKGEAVDLCNAFGGKVVLVVNTADHSPRVGQFRALQSLYEKYKDKGFVVIAFPSDDFHDGGDDPGQIAATLAKYGVTFPVFAPIHVTGPDTDPLYRDLFLQAGVPPFHDFDKYLIGRDGEVVGYFNAEITPSDTAFVTNIESRLAKPIR